MSWHLERIPKKAFFYWGTKSLPWVRYLTLETFRKYHPDWEMFLYKKPVLDDNTAKYSDTDCWDKISNLNINVVDIDVEERFGEQFPIKFITIYADIFRYIVLGEFGGFYIDMDNLFFRSLEEMPFNKEENNGFDVFIIKPPYHHIVMGVPGATWYKKVLEQQHATLPKTVNEFLNSTACTEMAKPGPEDKIFYLPMGTTEENFKKNGVISPNALCLNWHGSGVDSKYQMVNETNYLISDHPLASVIRYCLHGEFKPVGKVGEFLWIDRYE